jgi:hypothetical protein
MTIVGALQLEWDEVIYCLWDLLPASYAIIDSPGRVWPAAVEKAASLAGIAYTFSRVPDWESYEWGHIELSDSEILDAIFQSVGMPVGPVVFVPDSRMPPLNHRGQPEILPSWLLHHYVEEYPDKIFQGGTDLVFLFPEARQITTMMHEGWFTHIACPSSLNLI